jgi:hypothetical protein
VRITDEEVFLSYDEQKLYGYAFDKVGCKNKIKKLRLKEKEEKKPVYREFFQEQEQRFFAGKIGNRYASVDKNPYEISLVIADKLSDSGRFHVVFERNFDLTELCVKLGLASDDPLQIAQNNKRKTEIVSREFCSGRFRP